MWDWITWGIAALAVWVVVAALVGVLLGRVVRRRDRQVPTVEPSALPTPRAAREQSVPEHRRRS